MAAEFAGRQDDVEKFGPVQIIEIFHRVFHLVRGSRAFVDESAYRFRIRRMQAGSFPKFIVPVQSHIACRDEVLPTERLAFKRSGDLLVTTADFTLLWARHFPIL